jgi:hypothetical protein
MTTKAGVGMSRHHNPNVAGREAVEQALEKAGIVMPETLSSCSARSDTISPPCCGWSVRLPEVHPFRVAR